MKKIITSDIGASVGMPVKSGTLDHLQSAYTEIVAEALKALIGAGYSATKVYILNGLVNSGTAPAVNTTAGSVFYAGEVFRVDAASFTAGAGEVPVFTLSETFKLGTAFDPVEFTDGAPRNVHQIRKLAVTAGLPGSGIGGVNGNYSAAERITSNLAQLNLLAGVGISVTGTYPNLTVTNTSGTILQGILELGDLNSAPPDPNVTLLADGNTSLAAYVFNLPTALASASVGVEFTVRNASYTTKSQFDNNATLCVQLGSVSTTQIYFAISTANSEKTQDIFLQYRIFAL